MKKFFRMLFGRFTLVGLAIVLQLGISLVLPYALNAAYPNIFGYIYVPLNAVLYVMAFFLTLRIINSDMPPEGQLIWVIILLFSPIAGMIIYSLFVRRKAPRKDKKFLQKVADESLKYATFTPEEEEKLKKQLGAKYGQFEFIRKTTGLNVHSGSDVQFFSSGETFCQQLLDDLKQAKKYIFMEYFIIEEGQLWSSIFEVLKQKVSEGVEVRLMYDDLGTISKLPSNFYKKLNKVGIKCVRFNAFKPILSAIHNNRDHRKMTIIDGKVGFMSGLNLADEYVNIIHPFGHWKDTGIRMTGPAVDNLVIMFLQSFDVQSRKVDNFDIYIDHSEQKTKGSGFVCPYGDGPKYVYSEYVASNVYLNMINQASKYVWITTPYLIIDNKLTNALTSAARRGVDVRIVTPHIPDKKIVFSITRSSYGALQAAGVKIYEYEKGFIHSKQVLCDDELAIVGTINLDYRSLLHHYECGTLMYKTECLSSIKEDFCELFKVSCDMAGFKQKGFTRFMAALLKLFTPLL